MAEKLTYYYNNASPHIQFQSKWWSEKLKDEDRHQHIWGVVDGIKEAQSFRYKNYVLFGAFYSNLDLKGLEPGLQGMSQDTYLSHRVTLNVIKSCIDTAQSKIAKSRPRPFFMTEDGDWQMQRKAKMLTLYMDGWFDYAKVYQKTPMVFRDATIFGAGFVKLFIENGQVAIERVMPHELIVDDIEGMYGTPRQLHQEKNFFREVLADLYPDFKKEIMEAPSSVNKKYSTSYVADMVKVRESWHLPSGKDAKDGRHVISIANATLMSETYTKDYFPFVKYTWSDALIGYFGQGIAEELIGIQREINKILKNIQRAQELVAVPQVWVEGNSKVVSAHINNEIGGIKRFWGSPPIFMTPQAMSPEIYQYLESLYRRAYEITGISGLSAQSKKPSGLDAAVALRTMQDIETERFMITAQRYEELHLDIARMAIKMTKDLYEGDSEAGLEPARDLEVAAVDKEFMKKVKWKDIDLDEDKYVLRVFPTNLLPSTPAGKLESVQELMQVGFFDREDAIALLDFPDIKAVTSRITSARDDALRLISLMLEDGKYFSPEPFMNLKLCKTLTQSEYNKARTQNAPEERLELLRRFMDECDLALKKALEEEQKEAQEAQIEAAAQQMAQSGGQPVDPMAGAVAVPETPPVSELLPQV